MGSGAEGNKAAICLQVEQLSLGVYDTGEQTLLHSVFQGGHCCPLFCIFREFGG